MPEHAPTPWLVPLFLASAGVAAMAGAYVLLEALGLARRNLDLREKIVLPEMDSAILRAFLPAARSLGGVARALLGGARRPGAAVNLALGWLGRRLGGAGRPQGIDALEYAGFWILASWLGGASGAVAYGLVGPETGMPLWALSAAGAVLGAMGWWSWLSRRRARHRLDILRGLPFCLDLLALSTEAGLDFTAAIARLVRKTGDTPLGREFAYMLREIQLGKDRGAALRDFSRRVDVPEAGSVVASLVQAEELGASLGPVLRVLSAQQRERRSQYAEALAMKAPVKILAPLVLLLFPAVMVMIGFPVAYAWWWGR